jgi:hypothetical protein
MEPSQGETSESPRAALPSAAPADTKPPQPRLSKLGDTCHGIFDGFYEAGHQEILKHASGSENLTLENIETSAEQGCHFCHLQLRNLKETERTGLSGCKRIEIEGHKDWGHETPSLVFTYYYPHLNDDGDRRMYFIYKDAVIRAKQGTGFLPWQLGHCS